jgi:hypothetical protein
MIYIRDVNFFSRREIILHMSHTLNFCSMQDEVVNFTSCKLSPIKTLVLNQLGCVYEHNSGTYPHKHMFTHMTAHIHKCFYSTSEMSSPRT